MAERNDIKTPERKNAKQQMAAWDSSDGGIRLKQWQSMVAKIPRGNEVDWLVTHNRPHPDEIVMLWLVGTFPSDEYFRGVQEFLDMRKIEHIDLADIPLHIRSKSGQFGRDWLTNWQRGIRLLGTGGGPLDEHVVAGQERIQGESGATLMARLLDVNKNPDLRSMLTYILKNDTTAYRDDPKFDLAALVQSGYRRHDGEIQQGSSEDKANQLTVIKRALINLNEYYENELLRSRAASEFKEHGHLRAIGEGGNTVSITVVSSNNPYMNAYTRIRLQAAITVQKNSRGNVIIMSDQSQIPSDIMKELAATIREEEAQTWNRPLPRNEDDLYSEGALPCAPEWYFIYGKLLNGSEAAPGVEPTGLPLKRIESLVAEVINAKLGRILKFREEQKRLQKQRDGK